MHSYNRVYTMKTILKSVFISLLLTSPAFAYIPDIFSAYDKGREEANRQNYRDAERYQYIEQQRQPTLLVHVYSNNKKNPKKNKVVSLKKDDELCWLVYNVPTNSTFNSQEVITSRSQNTFDGDTTNNVVSKYRTNNNELVVQRKLSSQKDQVGACWWFHPNVDRGAYTFTLQIGNVSFQTQTFYIVD